MAGLTMGMNPVQGLLQHVTSASHHFMSSALLGRSRRARFRLRLHIIDLNNLPLAAGTSFVKWHLPASTAADHRGRTTTQSITDHRVCYDYFKQTNVRLTIGRDGMLQECWIVFEVVQEYSVSGKPERIRLGEVRLNLAEYVESPNDSPVSPVSNEDNKGIVRRHLMQDSKINSTLKLGVAMQFLDGSRDFQAPPLRAAPVFQGIAGIMSSGDPSNMMTPGLVLHSNADDARSLTELPALSRETAETQDLYRQALSAYWNAQPGELKADECIEDIFSGGDGWSADKRPFRHRQRGSISSVTTEKPRYAMYDNPPERANVVDGHGEDERSWVVGPRALA
ncbi:hypothetical protein K470DRAFT_257581 [Piedraia hortae CBS 480.64]|uniref:C2 NT-type domain-containing protein n=1 Tax=Piedraia hortae CBS 480.64 TaxID=1314780 RepID=A0A6A7C1H7_9PEZI|nr:hypothetical protein K470DRAFT_257581 [Piedraia hortae CBS 480.64]